MKKLKDKIINLFNRFFNSIKNHIFVIIKSFLIILIISAFLFMIYVVYRSCISLYERLDIIIGMFSVVATLFLGIAVYYQAKTFNKDAKNQEFKRQEPNLMFRLRVTDADNYIYQVSKSEKKKLGDKVLLRDVEIFDFPSKQWIISSDAIYKSGLKREELNKIFELTNMGSGFATNLIITIKVDGQDYMWPHTLLLDTREHIAFYFTFSPETLNTRYDIYVNYQDSLQNNYEHIFTAEPLSSLEDIAIPQGHMINCFGKKTIKSLEK